tara:strand:- start:435 stop:620 length:186 start_codon:yes stop_codon:yes gene_type:complete
MPNNIENQNIRPKTGVKRRGGPLGLSEMTSLMSSEQMLSPKSAGTCPKTSKKNKYMQMPRA